MKRYERENHEIQALYDKINSKMVELSSSTTKDRSKSNEIIIQKLRRLQVSKEMLIIVNRTLSELGIGDPI
jgi:hypothetical protein